jgi:uncharacterized protein (DUF1778 family)
MKSTRVKRVTLRMTYKEHEQLVKAANENNLNMSQHIRQYVPELKGANK